MTDKEVKGLYLMARSVAATFHISDYETEDLVQECVIKVWRVSTNPNSVLYVSKIDELYRYIRRIMRNRLLDLTKKRKFTFVELDEELYSAETRTEVPVPESSERVKRVTLALIRNKGSIVDAANATGENYQNVRRAWIDAKYMIRKEEKE